MESPRDYYCQALECLTQLPGSGIERRVVAIVKDGKVSLDENHPSLTIKCPMPYTYTYTNVVFSFVYEI